MKMISDLQSVSTEQDLGQVVEHLPPHGLVAVHVAGVAEHGLQHLSLLPHSSGYPAGGGSLFSHLFTHQYQKEGSRRMQPLSCLIPRISWSREDLPTVTILARSGNWSTRLLKWLLISLFSVYLWRGQDRSHLAHSVSEMGHRPNRSPPPSGPPVMHSKWMLPLKVKGILQGTPPPVHTLSREETFHRQHFMLELPFVRGELRVNNRKKLIIKMVCWIISSVAL